MLPLDGKVAVITGATSGISAGWAIAAVRPDRELFFRTFKSSLPTPR